VNTAIPILILALFAGFLSFQAAKEAAEKGHKLRGVCLSAFIGFCAWALLSQGFNDAWPASVGWVVFLAGALEALVTKKNLPS